MDLQQVIDGVQEHVDEAQNEYNVGNKDAAADCLAEVAGLVRRECGGSDEVPETPTTVEPEDS